MSIANTVDRVFEGSITEDEQGYEIHSFCEGMQPIEVNQDWENESTEYVFYDGSRVIVSGPTYKIQ
jgi:hypothetical protein